MPPRPQKSSASAHDPVALGDVLSQLFATRGYGRIQGDRQVRQIWQEIVGEETGGQTRVTGVKNGVLNVGVANSPLLSELAGFRKSEILARLKSEHADLRIRDIKFRLETRADRKQRTD